uniref:Uncharacterized protein n=1 Tax=Peronospora matthiolae TaxID=2874970 RepID=A0AAV1U6D9_9STRA
MPSAAKAAGSAAMRIRSVADEAKDLIAARDDLPAASLY